MRHPKFLLFISSFYQFLSYFYLRWLPSPWFFRTNVLLAVIYFSLWLRSRSTTVPYIDKEYNNDSSVAAIDTMNGSSTSVESRQARNRKPVPPTDIDSKIDFKGRYTPRPNHNQNFWRRYHSIASIINLILFIMLLDFTFRDHFIFRNHDLAFTRVGLVSDTYARVFVRYPRFGGNHTKVRVDYRTLEAEKEWTRGPLLDIEPENDYTATGTLVGLSPLTSYEWRIVDEEDNVLDMPKQIERNCAFKTAPPAGQPTRLRFGSGSCIKLNFPYPGPFIHEGVKGFKKMGKHKMDLLIFLGDFIYADVPFFFGSSTENYRLLYRQIYGSPEYQQIYERTPSLHVYDDHEIFNNWDSRDRDPMTSAMKAFMEYQGLPNGDPLVSDTAYFNYSYGDIAFFFLDTRRYRSPAIEPDTPQKTMLGERQKEIFKTWARDVNQTATFKFVISSVPLTRNWRGPDASKDTWGGYLKEREELLEFLKDVPNLHFLSGDRHEVAVTRLPHGMIDFSTSPVNQFYFPGVSTYKERKSEGTDEMIYYRRVGNMKYAIFDVDTEAVPPRFWYRLYVGEEGEEPVWEYEVVGTKVLP
ncbi:uncharacterized protein VTP21DRAFT_11548 [Calcarisporiella thermophila]|uniref:uncharacterized protein n=1 Tax=Calcarisporiella thermophila TaxID=911321 RepID=UPI003743327A